MRVFDKYAFNIIDKVKFKDTKKYLEGMLSDLGLNCDHIAFTFSNFVTKIDKVIEKYPNLKKYRCINYAEWDRDVLTYINPERANGNMYADPEDLDSIFTVAAKVPRGFNIYFSIKLDKIDWYGEGICEPVINFTKSRDEYPSKYERIIFESSRIEMGRGIQFLYGNSYNVIYLTIEATTSAGENVYLVMKKK